MSIVESKCCNCKTQISKYWCLDCKNKGFCLECNEIIHGMPANADHQISDSKPARIVHCKDHPTKEIEFWSEDNRTPYCSICLITKKQQQGTCQLMNVAVKEATDQVNISRFSLSSYVEFS